MRDAITAMNGAPAPDRQEIAKTLAVLFEPDEVIELRAIHSKGRKRTDAGYFDAQDRDSLTDEAVRLNAAGAAVYVTLNRIDPQLLGRYNNRVKEYAEATATDANIMRRRWILLDFDPVRPKDTSATNEQVEAAKATARECLAYLKGQGWPTPTTPISGNGMHLLYPCDLPNDDEVKDAIKAALVALAERFDDDAVKVDRSVFNAARITKLYGTVANKGDHTEHTPWRISRLTSTPGRAQLVSLEMLRALAPIAPATLPVHSVVVSKFDLADFLSRLGIAYAQDMHDGAERFKLDHCPFNPEHGKGEAAIFRRSNGALGFKCQHNSCADRTWQDVRMLVDGPPETRRPRADGASRAEHQPGKGNAPAGDQATIAVTTDEGKPRPQAAVLIDIGRKHTLFHDLGGDAYARLGNGGVCAVGSGEYREILGGTFYALTGKGANRNALADAVNTLAAIAKFEGPAEPVFLRVAESAGHIVIDTGRQDRSCCVVTVDDWRIVEISAVHFRRSGKPLPLPSPCEPDFNRLWRHVNVQPADRVLISAWLLAALRPRGPYPILVLIGEQGSGKSRTARALKALTDPSASPLRAPPQDVRDLMVAAISSWVLALDNMSGADPQLSDALCRLSTGGALSGRTLYTNAEETLIEVQRPVILNGIDDLATRPDLAERCIVLELPQLQQRATEDDMDAGLRLDAGAIFAALLDGLRLAQRDARTLEIGTLPRMADFAKWAAAGVPALGFTSEAFLAAYRANQAGAIEAGLDSSPVGQAVRAFMAAQRAWTGPASTLLRELAVHADTTSRSWPRSPKGLVNALRRLAPSLRHTGIVWSPARTAKGNVIILACKEPGQVPQLPQAPQSGALSGAMELMEDNRLACTTGIADPSGNEAGPVEVEI